MKKIILIVSIALSININAQTVLDSLIYNYNQNAIDNFKLLSNKSKNYTFCPASIEISFFQLYFGSKNFTLKSIQKFMNLSKNFDTNVNFAIFLNKKIIENNSFSSKFNQSIHLYADTSIKITKRFKELNRKMELCDTVYKIPMKEDKNRITQIIKNNVFKQSKINLYNQLKSEQIADTPSLILVNAINSEFYLSNQFTSYYESIFYQPSTGKEFQKVKYSFSNNYFKYNKSFDYEAVIVPMEQNSLSLLILIPQKTIVLDSFINKIDYKEIDFLINRSTYFEQIDLSIPTIKTETFEDNTELINKIPNIFEKKADYSNFSKKITYPSSLFSFVNLSIDINNENSIEDKSKPIEKSNVKYLEINKPFYYIIFENKKNVIIIIGKIFEVK